MLLRQPSASLGHCSGRRCGRWEFRSPQGSSPVSSLLWKRLVTPRRPTRGADAQTATFLIKLKADASSPCASGLLGALPGGRAHHAVPAREWQGATVDSGERGTRDVSAASGPSVLPQAARLLPRRLGDGASLPHAGGRIHWPQESQVRHEVAVRDVCVEETGTESDVEGRGKNGWVIQEGDNHFSFFLFLLFFFFFLYITLSLFQSFFFISLGGLDGTVLPHFRLLRLLAPRPPVRACHWEPEPF